MVVTLLFACSTEDDLTGPPVDANLAPAGEVTVIEGPDFIRVEGEAAGALWAAIKPEDWNGDLVVLMHGTVPQSAPISLDPALHWWWRPVTDALVERGFGVAFSSYRVNDIAIREGTIDTRIAQARFTSQFGNPEAVYLVGWSMGSLIGQKLLETSSEKYDGFLSVCGTLGGLDAQVDRFFNSRILFDHFFPGVLPGDVLTADFDFLGLIPVIAGAVSGDFGTAMELASIDQVYITWTNPVELVFGVVGSLFGSANTQILQERAHGVPFDNTGTVYTSALLSPAELETLNGSVDRFSGDPQALRYLENNYEPRGVLRGTKVLSLHTARDPLAPVDLHLPAFEEVLKSAGNQDLHVARIVEGFGHCEFGFDAQPDPFLDVELEAFDDLVEWVQKGVKPTP